MSSVHLRSFARTVNDPESLRVALRELWVACEGIDWSGAFRLTFEPHKEARSLAQNRRYWALVGQWAIQAPQHMDGEWHAPEVWHEFFKRQFLGVEVVSVMGDPVPMVCASRTLKTDQFAEFMAEVEAWMVDHGLEALGGL